MAGDDGQSHKVGNAVFGSLLYLLGLCYLVFHLCKASPFGYQAVESQAQKSSFQSIEGAFKGTYSDSDLLTEAKIREKVC